MRPRDNIFGSLGEGVAYFCLYYLIPCTQIFAYIEAQQSDFCLSALFLFSSSLFDLYLRYRDEKNGKHDAFKLFKLKIMLAVYAILWCITVVFTLLFYMSNLQIHPWICLFYLPMAVPLFIILTDIISHFKYI